MRFEPGKMSKTGAMEFLARGTATSDDIAHQVLVERYITALQQFVDLQPGAFPCAPNTQLRRLDYYGVTDISTNESYNRFAELATRAGLDPSYL